MELKKRFKNCFAIVLAALFSGVFTQNALANDGIKLVCTVKNPHMTKNKAGEIIRGILINPYNHVEQCLPLIEKTEEELGIECDCSSEEEEKKEEEKKEEEKKEEEKKICPQEILGSAAYKKRLTENPAFLLYMCDGRECPCNNTIWRNRFGCVVGSKLRRGLVDVGSGELLQTAVILAHKLKKDPKAELAVYLVDPTYKGYIDHFKNEGLDTVDVGKQYEFDYGNDALDHERFKQFVTLLSVAYPSAKLSFFVYQSTQDLISDFEAKKSSVFPDVIAGADYDESLETALPDVEKIFQFAASNRTDENDTSKILLVETTLESKIVQIVNETLVNDDKKSKEDQVEDNVDHGLQIEDVLVEKS